MPLVWLVKMFDKQGNYQDRLTLDSSKLFSARHNMCGIDGACCVIFCVQYLSIMYYWLQLRGKWFEVIRNKTFNGIVNMGFHGYISPGGLLVNPTSDFLRTRFYKTQASNMDVLKIEIFNSNKRLKIAFKSKLVISWMFNREFFNGNFRLLNVTKQIWWEKWSWKLRDNFYLFNFTSFTFFFFFFFYIYPICSVLLYICSYC